MKIKWAFQSCQKEIWHNLFCLSFFLSSLYIDHRYYEALSINSNIGILYEFVFNNWFISHQSSFLAFFVYLVFFLKYAEFMANIILKYSRILNFFIWAEVVITCRSSCCSQDVVLSCIMVMIFYFPLRTYASLLGYCTSPKIIFRVQVSFSVVYQHFPIWLDLNSSSFPVNFQSLMISSAFCMPAVVFYYISSLLNQLSHS